MIRSLGSPKQSYSGDDMKSKNDTYIDYISRAVMRAPSDEAMHLITQAKEKLKLFFEGCTEEEIQWVFAHGKESRGFFQSYTESDSLEHRNVRDGLFKWLDRPTSSSWSQGSEAADTTSMDISLLNGIIASLSYAAFDYNTDYAKTDLNGNVVIHDCGEIKSKCAELMSQAPYVGAYLKERNDAIVK